MPGAAGSLETRHRSNVHRNFFHAHRSRRKRNRGVLTRSNHQPARLRSPVLPTCQFETPLISNSVLTSKSGVKATTISSASGSRRSRSCVIRSMTASNAGSSAGLTSPERGNSRTSPRHHRSMMGPATIRIGKRHQEPNVDGEISKKRNLDLGSVGEPLDQREYQQGQPRDRPGQHGTEDDSLAFRCAGPKTVAHEIDETSSNQREALGERRIYCVHFAKRNPAGWSLNSLCPARQRRRFPRHQNLRVTPIVLNVGSRSSQTLRGSYRLKSPRGRRALKDTSEQLCTTSPNCL